MSANINLLSVVDTQMFPGIGWKLGERILANFSADEFLNLLDEGRCEEFTRIAGISGRKVLVLQSGYAFTKPILQLARYLDKNGLTRRSSVTRIYRSWRQESLAKIHSNPYRLLAVADWPEVDPLGLSRGPEFHPCRLVGAIEWCMYQDFEERQNTAIDEASLRTMVQDLIRCNEEDFQKGLKLAIDTKTIVEYEGWYQAPATFFVERGLEKFLKYNPRTFFSHNLIEKWLNEKHKGLTEEQRGAVKNALLHRISVFYGRGGRGKTWTLKAIVAGAEATHLLQKKVFLCAVAAKAVKRMQKETGHPIERCRTVAYLLHRVKPGDLANSMVIIDEASMLSLLDAFQVLEKLPLNSNLVLLGDHAQIPSIQAGRVLFDIIDTRAVPSSELTLNMRQDSKTDGQLNEIIDGAFPVLDDYYEGCSTGLYRRLVVKNQRPMTDSVHIIEDEAVELYMALTRKGESVQVISPLRNHSGGSEAINKKIHQKIFACTDLCVGTPVVYKKNMKTEVGAWLTNGSVGYIHKVFAQGSGRFHLEVSFEHEGVIPLTREETSEFLEMSYCLTVHQAQGSEWDNVIIALPPSKRMIDRNMIYTAMSRCRNRAIAVYADHIFIEDRVKAPGAHQKRRSLFLRGTNV